MPKVFLSEAPGLARAIEVEMLATTYCLARHQKQRRRVVRGLPRLQYDTARLRTEDFKAQRRRRDAELSKI